MTAIDPTTGALTFTVANNTTVGGLIDAYGEANIVCTPTTDGGKITEWVNTGAIAFGLGMD